MFLKLEKEVIVKIEKYSYSGDCANSHGVKLSGDNLMIACEVLGISLFGFDGDYVDLELIIECADDMSYIQYLLQDSVEGGSFEHDMITFEEFCNVLLELE